MPSPSTSITTLLRLIQGIDFPDIAEKILAENFAPHDLYCLLAACPYTVKKDILRAFLHARYCQQYCCYAVYIAHVLGEACFADDFRSAPAIAVVNVGRISGPRTEDILRNNSSRCRFSAEVFGICCSATYVCAHLHVYPPTKVYRLKCAAWGYTAAVHCVAAQTNGRTLAVQSKKTPVDKMLAKVFEAEPKGSDLCELFKAAYKAGALNLIDYLRKRFPCMRWPTTWFTEEAMVNRLCELLWTVIQTKSAKVFRHAMLNVILPVGVDFACTSRMVMNLFVPACTEKLRCRIDHRDLTLDETCFVMACGVSLEMSRTVQKFFGLHSVNIYGFLAAGCSGQLDVLQYIKDQVPYMIDNLKKLYAETVQTYPRYECRTIHHGRSLAHLGEYLSLVFQASTDAGYWLVHELNIDPKVWVMYTIYGLRERGAWLTEPAEKARVNGTARDLLCKYMLGA